jgi:hypothetical protein
MSGTSPRIAMFGPSVRASALATSACMASRNLAAATSGE